MAEAACNNSNPWLGIKKISISRVTEREGGIAHQLKNLKTDKRFDWYPHMFLIPLLGEKYCISKKRVVDPRQEKHGPAFPSVNMFVILLAGWCPNEARGQFRMW